jgi:CheY-like chemotaxis protein
MTKTILVVDDEEDNRTTLKGILEKNKYAVMIAEDGASCLQELQKQKPDLIMLDMMMPKMPTRELLAKINGIKIIFVSGVQMSEAEKRELIGKKGVVDFIQKPYDIKDLLQRVKRHLLQ